MPEKMNSINKNKNVSRKRFLTWGLIIPVSFAIPAFLRKRPKNNAPQTMKMLTQEGKLVEIQVQNIPDQRKKIKTEDIHNWISKK